MKSVAFKGRGEKHETIALHQILVNSYLLLVALWDAGLGYVGRGAEVEKI